MKFLLLNLLLFLLLLCQFSAAADAQGSRTSAECTKIDLKSDIKSFWYVPINQQKVHFVALSDGVSLKKYIIKGDLVIANSETPEFVCAHYVKKGRVAASGWLRKAEINAFKVVDFGSSEVPGSQKGIPSANKALTSLAKRLPEIRDWHGTYQDSNGNSVKIWKKGPLWRLSTMGIIGSIGSDDEEESAQNLVTYGARAEYREDKKKYDVCDIVIIGFNNALLATSGSHCMGSGANHEYPEFNGLYWKQ